MDQKLKEEMQLSSAGKDQSQKSEMPKGKNTAMAAIAYIVFFIPLLAEDRNDPFMKFHIKQGMVLFIAWVIVGILSMVPLIGGLFSGLAMLVILILMIIGIAGALKGEEKLLPVIGKYAKNFNI